MSKKTDLRVVKTRQALISTMLMMLNEMSFGKITVNEICARALVSRSAFYTHFLDKYDLATYCMEEISRRLIATAQDQSSRAQLRSLLENVSQDSRAFQNLLMADFDAELIELFRKGFLQKFYQHQEDIHPDLSFPPPRDVSAIFCAAGFTNAVMLWIRSGMQYTVEEMTDCIWALMPKKNGD